MTEFLVGYHIRDRSQEEVGAAIRFARFTPAWVSPCHGPWISVFPEPAETMDMEVLNRIGTLLSRTLKTYVWSALLNDSRSLLYTVYEKGEVKAEYDSFPELYGSKSRSYRRLTDGKPGLMVDLCPAAVPLETMEEVLFRKPLAEAVSEVALEEKVDCEEELMSLMPEEYVHERIMEKRGYATEKIRLAELARLLGVSYALHTYSELSEKMKKGPSDLAGADEFMQVNR
ncbi:MAG: hypothetical protein R6V10_07255 [bacterium]